MDIPSTAAPVAAKPPATDKSAASPQTPEGALGAPAFSALLQGLQGLPGEAPAALLPLTGLNPSAAAVAEGQALPATHLLDGLLHLDGLVGQTQRLDAVDADAAVQDGSFLLTQQDAGLAAAWGASQGGGAQPQIAAGQQVATVAAGVQSALPAPALTGWTDPAATAAAQLAQAGDVAESVAQTLNEGLALDEAGEGRVALHGAWKLDDPQAAPNPALQRVMGQVEQWVAANLGGQRKATELGDSGKSSATTTELLAAGQGSGTRLTEHAVKETQQAQNAAFEQVGEAPVEDMRFWLQGKQQRAEVVMEKDGQPVRVQVSVRGNEAQVVFKADQAQTRELLDASLAQLESMLAQQGLQLTGASVQADARGQQSAPQDGQRSPWAGGPVRHAQVAVPVDAAPPARGQRAQGLDLYA